MPRKKKILIILQLCFAFAYLFWLLVQPYVKEVVSQKSQIALYEMVLEREAFFRALPLADQQALVAGSATVHQHQGPSLWKQLATLLFVDTPPFALAWLFFTIAVCILLLLRIEGSAFAAWLLPLIVVGYVYFLQPHARSKDSLFPPEAYVRAEYLSAAEQESMGYRDALLLGWHRFIVTEWAHEQPSTDETKFASQLDKGLFAFNVARLKWILAGKGDEVVLAGFTTPPSLLRLACYFIWNLLFAWIINRKEKSGPTVAASAPSC